MATQHTTPLNELANDIASIGMETIDQLRSLLQAIADRSEGTTRDLAMIGKNLADERHNYLGCMREDLMQGVKK